ncbi:hypothetical protein [Streptomyces sp. W1SF4]|uniref:hypothetical protein n=1 Tax=Streptomyces sp. W1SF4 TaxID=2305220 RepID=UPI000F6DB991|nr:hypothetical protein [Streptomyces sp. W1SF4]AZM90587.1 hypothetical protein D1J60_20815 [Streptomyces sp. W1SF4]
MSDQPDQPADPAGEPEQAAGEDGEAPEQEKKTEEEAQQPWATRRELHAHAPKSMAFDGTNHGVVADRIFGNVTTEIHYSFGGLGSDAPASGEIPPAYLDRLSDVFVDEGTRFAQLRDRLLKEQVLVLTGTPFTGRRAAALMLLRSVGATPVHALDGTTTPGNLAGLLSPPGKAGGYLLCDLNTSRDDPLREAQFNRLRDLLHERETHLVITTGVGSYLEDAIRPEEWKPPGQKAVLAARLTVDVGAEAASRLLALPAVDEFLARDHQLREVVGYATELRQYAVGLRDESELADYSLRALKDQVREWFAEPEEIVHLREKAFLIALAAFDGGPYALTAELSDLLYSQLQRVGDPKRYEAIPVFSTHIGKRLQLARAGTYPEREDTEWGEVTQLKAAFRDDRTALVLLPEVWTGHPAARPALVKWLNELADDGRPLVRTRAAATAAVLARTDLPSAMALIIEPWARSDRARRRTTAVSALTLAHQIDAPNIPRIVDAWSADADDPRPCWVAVRAQGLIGTERPEAALAALRAQAHRQHGKKKPDPQVRDELPKSVALLLLSPRADSVLAELLRTLPDHRSTHELAVRGFLTACGRRDEEAGHGRPLVLDWYARADQDDTPTAPAIVRLLRDALDDRAYTEDAEQVLRGWIRAADQDEKTEWALASLLTRLAATPRETSRLDYLLRNPQGVDGGPYPEVATRLRVALTRPTSA